MIRQTRTRTTRWTPVGELFEPLPASDPAAASGVLLPTPLSSQLPCSSGSIPTSTIPCLSPPTALPSSTAPCSATTPTSSGYEQPQHASSSSSCTVLPADKRGRGGPTSPSDRQPQAQFGRSESCRKQLELQASIGYVQGSPQGVGGLPWGQTLSFEGRTNSRLQSLSHQPADDGAIRSTETGSRPLESTSQTSSRGGERRVGSDCIHSVRHDDDDDENQTRRGRQERQGEGEGTIIPLIFYPLLLSLSSQKKMN